MQWYVEVLKKYAVFSGRARRKEYWMFTLFSIVITIILTIVGNAVHTSAIQMVYELAVLLPGLGVSIRRLHDTGRSGWWLFIGLIPVVGFIILLVFMASDGKPETNAYGPNPKLVAGY